MVHWTDNKRDPATGKRITSTDGYSVVREDLPASPLEGAGINHYFRTMMESAGLPLPAQPVAEPEPEPEQRHLNDLYDTSSIHRENLRLEQERLKRVNGGKRRSRRGDLDRRVSGASVSHHAGELSDETAEQLRDHSSARLDALVDAHPTTPLTAEPHRHESRDVPLVPKGYVQRERRPLPPQQTYRPKH